MRFLRLTLSLICCLFLGLTGVVWWQNMAVVDYAVKEAHTLHYLAHRMYYLQVCEHGAKRCQTQAPLRM